MYNLLFILGKLRLKQKMTEKQIELRTPQKILALSIELSGNRQNAISRGYGAIILQFARALLIYMEINIFQ